MASLVRSWGWFRISVSLVALAFVTFLLPYFIPVAPSVSLSYLAQFNNRAAVIGFLCFGALSAWLAIDLLPATASDDTPLPRWTLAATVVATLLVAILWRLHHWHIFGSESPYAIERQMHLDGGQRIYRDFEFIYGPVLIYPGHLLSSFFHKSTRDLPRLTQLVKLLQVLFRKIDKGAHHDSPDIPR